MFADLGPQIRKRYAYINENPGLVSETVGYYIYMPTNLLNNRRSCISILKIVMARLTSVAKISSEKRYQNHRDCDSIGDLRFDQIFTSFIAGGW